MAPSQNPLRVSDCGGSGRPGRFYLTNKSAEPGMPVSCLHELVRRLIWWTHAEPLLLG